MRVINIVRTSWIANILSFIGGVAILISLFTLVLILFMFWGEPLVVSYGVGAAVGGIISGIMFLAWSEVIDILLDIRNEIVGENAKKQSADKETRQ